MWFSGISAIGNKAVKGNPEIKDKLYNALKYYVFESISSNEINQVVALKLRFLLHTFIMIEEELVPLTRIIVQIKPKELELTTCQSRLFVCLFSPADHLDDYSRLLTNQTLHQYTTLLKSFTIKQEDDEEHVSDLRRCLNDDLDCVNQIVKAVSFPLF